MSFTFTFWINPAITVAANKGAAGAKIHLNATPASFALFASLNQVAQCPNEKSIVEIVCSCKGSFITLTTGLVPTIKTTIKIYGSQAKIASLVETATVSNPSSALTNIFVATIIKIIAIKLEIIVGSSAPVVIAINGCIIYPIIDAITTGKIPFPKAGFFPPSISLFAKTTKIKGITQVNSNNSNDVNNAVCWAFNPKFEIIVVTGSPTVPNAVGVEFAIKQIIAAVIGENPKEIIIAAGIATAVPYPAIPSINPPNPQASIKACARLSDVIFPNIVLMISILPFFTDKS